MEELSEYVTLVSAEGHEFTVRRSAAMISGTIKRMIDPTSGFREASLNRCEFPDINTIVLDKVCEYLYYHEKYKDAKDVPDMEIPPELCLLMLVAADFLLL